MATRWKVHWGATALAILAFLLPFIVIGILTNFVFTSPVFEPTEKPELSGALRLFAHARGQLQAVAAAAA